MMKINQEIPTTSQETAVSITLAHREEILLTISDMSKDATGMRLRYDYANMSDGELLRWVEYFTDEFESNMILEAEDDAAALTKYEARLDALINDHGISKADAIRWDMQAEGMDINDGAREFEHYLYTLGIAFSDMMPYKELYDNSIMKEAV
jgi:hypothetical protein